MCGYACMYFKQSWCYNSANKFIHIFIWLVVVNFNFYGYSSPNRELQKRRLKHMHSIVMRDGLRNEVAKQNAIYAEMKSTVEQQKMDLSKLNMMMNQGEDESSKLRERYSVEEKKRNDRWESLPVYTCVIAGLHVALL